MVRTDDLIADRPISMWPAWAQVRNADRLGLWQNTETAAFHAYQRARFNHFQKMRLWFGVPYHEWQEALVLARYSFKRGSPTFDVSPIRALLEAYAPRFDMHDGSEVAAPREAPWTLADQVVLATKKRAAAIEPRPGTRGAAIGKGAKGGTRTDVRYDGAETVGEIVGVIGEVAAAKLFEHFGGINLYVPFRIPDDHRITRAIGREAADKLCAWACGSALFVPKRGNMLSTYDRVVQAYAEGGRTGAQIAVENDISERQVWRILQMARANAATA